MFTHYSIQSSEKRTDLLSKMYADLTYCDSGLTQNNLHAILHPKALADESINKK